MGSLVRVIALMAIVSLLSSQLVFSMEPSLKVLGTVTGRGEAKVGTSFNNWLDINGRSYPCFNGMHLKTGDGSAAINLKNGVRLETGKESEIIFSQESMDYSVNLIEGGLSFSVPEGVSLSVITPTASISTTPINATKKVSSDSLTIKGIVIFDGKGTKVISLSGAITVRDINGASSHVVNPGNAVYLANEKTSVRSVVLPSEAIGGSSLSAALPAIIGSAVVLGTYFTVNSSTKVKSVSPWRP